MIVVKIAKIITKKHDEQVQRANRCCFDVVKIWKFLGSEIL